MEILQIVLLSLTVSLLSGVISFAGGFTLSTYLYISKSRYKKNIDNFYRALTGVPTIIFGLIALLLLSKKGIFGSFKLLFSPTAIVFAQFLLLFPLAYTLCNDLYGTEGEKILLLSKVIKVPKKKIFHLFFRELKKNLLGIFLLIFSRAISEVGAVMMVGGNIKGYTRVMTTYIALSTSMGNYEKSIGIAFILFFISYGINSILRRID
ncbi:MAG: ABC transporter permease [Fusobacteriaceae bacterium]